MRMLAIEGLTSNINQAEPVTLDKKEITAGTI